MIDKHEPEFRVTENIETTDHGTSKYLPLAMWMLELCQADAVAVVVINGKLGTGGTGAAVSGAALAQLPDVLRSVADLQAREAAAWRAKSGE